MIKTAICLSGHSRYYDQIELPNIDADYFISTYNQNGYLPIKPIDNPIAFHAFDHIETGIIDRNKLIEYFNPKLILISNDDCHEIIKSKFGDNKTFAGVILRNVALMFYKIKEANALKKQYEYENNFKYDFVFRYRFDTKLNHINFENFTNTLYIKRKAENNFYDMMYGGDSNIMDIASNCFDWIMEQPVSELQKIKDAEHILFQYLKFSLNNIRISEEFNYTFYSLRDGIYTI